MPKVSLIMPVYNSEKTLDISVGSILNQTDKDIEFIAVDDGSTDNSLEKLQQLKQKSPIDFKIYNKKNGGAASARKYGLNKSNSDIVGFVDSDDYVDKDYVSKLYDTLVSTDTNISVSRMAFHLNMPVLKKYH